MQSEGRQLIEAYLRGDRAAVERVEQWIRAAASAYYRTLAHEWEDVLQDLRLEVLSELGKGRYQGKAKVKTYVWRVVSHSCLDRVRAARRWRWTGLEDDPGAGGVESPAGGGLPHEVADLLLRVLERTSEECRELWRRIVRGESYREISSDLGISEGALRVRALRCRRAAQEIRDRLEGDPAGEV
ncbi:MAG: sigma-70 family RNA polymerase sigma factor [Thermoanaerobaculia bacterium]|nr:sigma-70 family RNA polymerase sigma factor [Thermoanaerobaculia bacterium]